MLVVFGVIAASGVVLLGSAGAIKAVAPKTEVGLKRENVPLPPVINPSPPPLERPTSMTQRTESSFASIGRPTGESGAVVAPPAQWETPMPRPGQSSSTLAAPGGATDSFVVLGAPSQPQ
jgi:hypothetical protein